MLRFAPFAETQALPRVAAFLLARDWDVDVMVLDRDEDRPARQSIEGANVVWRRIRYRPGSKISFFFAWLRWWMHVIRHLRRNRYDVVHACNVECAIPAILARWLYRTEHRIVYDVRDFWGMAGGTKGWVPRAMQAVERWAARHSTSLLLSQGRLARTGRFLGRGVRERTPTIQLLNVPAEDIGARPLPNLDGRLRINFTGHISYARNAAAIIELARALPDEIMVDVAGVFTRYQDVREKLESCPNVTIYGRLPHHEAMALMAEAHVVAVLYDTGSEVAIVASANKMFEAMMLGRPYVASDGGFPALVAEAFGSGFVVPYGDAMPLIRLARNLLHHPERLEKAAKAARETFLHRFRWASQEANLEALYRFLLDSKSEPTRRSHGFAHLLGHAFDLAEVRSEPGE